jgi:Tfp pilus assembly protein PilV
MVSIVVLTIGLVGVAALMSQTVNNTSHSRYNSIASLLASEKLEDLNRYPSTDPNVAAGGSITADTSGYFDTVYISSDQGAISETTSSTVAGVTTYTTVSQQPNGVPPSPTSSTTAPTITSDMLTYDRRWVIVANTPVTGVRQITVLVTLKSNALNPPVTYQITAVHP